MSRAWQDLLGKAVWTGCGEFLGRVERIVTLPNEEHALVVRQADGKEWLVEAAHIKGVSDRVMLKGPREGFHIAPLAPVLGRLARAAEPVLASQGAP